MCRKYIINLKNIYNITNLHIFQAKKNKPTKFSIIWQVYLLTTSYYISIVVLLILEKVNVKVAMTSSKFWSLISKDTLFK